MYKFKKNFLCAGILDHTLNVILGFIPRIHAKHSPLDTRDKPEYDDSKRMFFKPEYNNEVVKSVGTSENGNYVAQCGRSMMEMLGVLAIVGVLSIGGIAGYSKAMNMYKINRWSAYYTELLANLQIAFSTTGTYGDKSEDLTNTVISAGLMPEGMVDANHKDIFGNRVYVLSRDWAGLYGVRLNIQYNMQAGKAAVDCCNKLFEMGQLYPNLWIVWISETDYGVCGGGAPDSYIRNMGCVRYNKAAVASNCKICESQACSILTLLSNSVY